MDFATLITRMTEAAVRGDGKAVAECFAAGGVYHDVFYGSFKGAAIVEMIEKRFHRDGENFRWDVHDAVEQDGIGYARYVFSYDSRLPGAEGRRAVFEGVSICRLEGDRIAEYREVANAATGLHMLGFAPERLARFIAREAEALSAREEAAAHRPDRGRRAE